MQNFDTSFENITATMAQLRQAEADQLRHYTLFQYEDLGWQWLGIGLFDGVGSEPGEYFASADAARTAADAAIRKALS